MSHADENRCKKLCTEKSSLDLYLEDSSEKNNILNVKKLTPVDMVMEQDKFSNMYVEDGRPAKFVQESNRYNYWFLVCQLNGNGYNNKLCTDTLLHYQAPVQKKFRDWIMTEFMSKTDKFLRILFILNEKDQARTKYDGLFWELKKTVDDKIFVFEKNINLKDTDFKITKEPEKDSCLCYYTSKFGDSMELKSKAEAHFAIFLDMTLGKKFTYEQIRLKYDKNNWYTPDFHTGDICVYDNQNDVDFASPLFQSLLIEIKASEPTLEEQDKCMKASVMNHVNFCMIWFDCHSTSWRKNGLYVTQNIHCTVFHKDGKITPQAYFNLRKTQTGASYLSLGPVVDLYEKFDTYIYECYIKSRTYITKMGKQCQDRKNQDNQVRVLYLNFTDCC